MPLPDIDTNLVGWWKFDDGSGNTAVDSSASGNNGDLTGHAPSWVSGKVGSNALSFVSASSQYVLVGDKTALKITGNITVAAWINLTSLGTQVVCEKGFDGSNEPYTMRFIFSDTIQWFTFNGSNHGVTAYHHSFNAGEWHHLAGTFDGTTWILYVDGVQVDQSVDSQAPADTTTRFVIGARDESGTINTFFNGTIDDVRVYSRGLSPTDIAKLFSLGARKLLLGGHTGR